LGIKHSKLMKGSVESLRQLNKVKMPYGKFRGVALIDLPEPYVIWHVENVESSGQLRQLFKELYEIKVNGLEKLVKSISQ